MNRGIIITAFLLFVVFKNNTFAQDALKMAEDSNSKKDSQIYNIQPLEGGNQKVHIMPDYANRVLKISYLKDTITINDYWGVPADVAVLNKNFIEVSYAVRGGSNLGLDNITLLCVSGNKLYEAIHVLESIDWESGDEQELYKVKITLNGINKKTYKLLVGIHDKVNSKHNPETNYNYNNQTVLNFDISRNVFYSVKENIYNSFIIYPKTGKNHKEKLHGNYPVIILGKETYYYVKGGWYNLRRNNELDGFTTHTARCFLGISDTTIP